MEVKDNADDDYYQYQAPYKLIVDSAANFIRTRQFGNLMKVISPQAEWKILDVGVTATQNKATNFFERLYPFRQNLTAVGLDDASYLEQWYPGLKFVQADAMSLPFPDQSFELAVSFAVIEHVGSRARQRAFVQELSRVSKSFYITTPNRWYPIEFHTVMPFIHWLPADLFRKILKMLNREFYASEETLNLLSEKELLALVPPGFSVTKMHSRFFGPISNLCIYAQPTAE
ncbi:hypothetical protein BH10CYA1_BH10CYA1_19970 [soil metagenome]